VTVFYGPEQRGEILVKYAGHWAQLVFKVQQGQPDLLARKVKLVYKDHLALQV
jgi:hypothetical protein